jgi:hypothetical protein
LDRLGLGHSSDPPFADPAIQLTGLRRCRSHDLHLHRSRRPIFSRALIDHEHSQHRLQSLFAICSCA